MKRILVTGANGQLGSEIKFASSSIEQFDFNFIDVDDYDLFDFPKFEEFLCATPFDYIVNCAAYTAVDKAETESSTADMLNNTFVKNLAILCSKLNITLVHISTDFVFNGSGNHPLIEEDQANPISIYGKTKLDGEEAIRVNHDRHYIIRTSWLYSSFGNNFVKTILKLSEKNNEINVVCDQYGTPTYARDLAMTILELLKSSSENYGTYHFSNEGVASWYDFAQKIIDTANHSTKVHPILSSEYVTPASRPAFSVMSKSKIKKQFDIKINHWCKSLEDCMRLL